MSDPDVTQDDKDLLTSNAGKLFFFASGGITSADNLLVHPEAFIRNYLLGRQWLTATFGATAANGAVSNQMWIPDDFGHDTQLPSLLQAMGFTGAGFWRIPAQCGVYNTNCSNGDGTTDAPNVYLPEKVGLDFVWAANDRSAVQAHWLSEGYCQGNSLGSGDSINSNWATTISTFIAQNTTAVMPTPYMFTPIDCDFAAPYDNGPSIFDQWNSRGETTYAVQAVRRLHEARRRGDERARRNEAVDPDGASRRHRTAAAVHPESLLLRVLRQQAVSEDEALPDRAAAADDGVDAAPAASNRQQRGARGVDPAREGVEPARAVDPSRLHHRHIAERDVRHRRQRLPRRAGR